MHKYSSRVKKRKTSSILYRCFLGLENKKPLGTFEVISVPGDFFKELIKAVRVSDPADRNKHIY